MPTGTNGARHHDASPHVAGVALPNNLDAEQSALGAVILRASILRDPAFILASDDFYDRRNEIVFAAMEELAQAGEPIDEITIKDRLQQAGKLEAGGGLAYIAQLALRVPTSDNAVAYAGIVRSLADKRRTALELRALAARVLQPDVEVDAAFWSQVESRIRSIGARATADRAIEEMFGGDLSAFLGDEEPDDDPSRDYAVHGIIPRAAPFIIGGHPKQGKTLLVEDLAVAIASGAADWCGFTISEDMRGGRVLLMPREDSSTETKVRLWRLARGRGIDPRDLAGKLEVDPTSALYLDDADLVSKLRRTAERFDVILIDSLQTVHRGDENSARDMAVVCGAWRDIALTSGKAVGLIHHFNGKGAEGDARDPGHKLRGSSAVFATARHVVGIERLQKPEGAVAVRVSGNLSHIPDPFAVRRVESQLATGRLAWRYEALGKIGELRDCGMADAILDLVSKAMPKGLGSRALREAVREEIGASDSGVIDREIRGLSREGRLVRHTFKSPWRLPEES